MILTILVSFLIIGLAIVIFLIIRRTELSQKNKERLEKLKKMFFYNLFIRFAFLGALKLNMSSITIFKMKSSSASSIIVACLLLIIIAVAVPTILCRVLYKRR